MNKQQASNLLVGGAAFVGGAAIGTFVSKKILKKAPQLQPVLIWTSGMLVGASMATVLAPRFIDKSTAASILASD